MKTTTTNEAVEKCCPYCIGSVFSRCQGDGCMGWRNAGENTGYCGMAGKPSQVALTEALAGARMLKDLMDGKIEGGAA